MNKLNKFFEKYRIVITVIAVCSVVAVIVSTIRLYAHYGPLTPNGNRYHHSFDMLTVEWDLVRLAFIAMALQVYPVVRFCFSRNPEWHCWGFFPARSTIGKGFSLILTCFNAILGFVYTAYFCLMTNEYVDNSSRVMAEDLETVIQGFAYICCILFWGLVNLIYSICYKFKW